MSDEKTTALAARIAEAIEDGGIGVGDAFRLWLRGDRPASRPALVLAQELAEYLQLDVEASVAKEEQGQIAALRALVYEAAHKLTEVEWQDSDQETVPALVARLEQAGAAASTAATVHDVSLRMDVLNKAAAGVLACFDEAAYGIRGSKEDAGREQCAREWAAQQVGYYARSLAATRLQALGASVDACVKTWTPS